VDRISWGLQNWGRKGRGEAGLGVRKKKKTDEKKKEGLMD